MTIFLGRITPGRRYVVTWLDEEGEHELDPYLDVQCHSPTGFSWGYGGSGPAQLALALLCHVCRTTDEAQDHYQEFKRLVVSNIPQDMGWILSEDAVRRWLAGQLSGRPVAFWPALLPQHPLSAYTAHG